MAAKAKIRRRKEIFWFNLSILVIAAGVVAALVLLPRHAEQTSTVVTTIPTETDSMVYGISLGSAPRSWSKDKLDDSMKLVKDLGVKSIRFDVSWSALQPKDARHYEWEQFDNIVKSAQKQGISSLIILDYTPAWARLPACKDVEQCPPADNAQFATYAKAVVQRYKPMGVNAYEIWNEPNSNQFWPPAANAEAYKSLLQTTSAAIRAQDADVTIIMGGLSPAGDPSEAIAPRLFLQRMYQLGAKEDFDAIAMHPYTFPYLTNQPQTVNWSQMDAGESNLRSTMVANGDSDKKIWVTEYGAPTGGPGSGATSLITAAGVSYNHVNEDLQADMAKAAIQSAQTKPWLAGFYWYTLYDGPKGSTSNEGYFGLIDSSGNPKPAYYQLRKSIEGIQ